MVLSFDKKKKKKIEMPSVSKLASFSQFSTESRNNPSRLIVIYFNVNNQLRKDFYKLADRFLSSASASELNVKFYEIEKKDEIVAKTLIKGADLSVSNFAFFKNEIEIDVYRVNPSDMPSSQMVCGQK